MITEKDNVFYCDCGFSFARGRSGTHDCATGLRKRLAESEEKCVALAAENAGLKAASSCLVSEYMMNKGADNEFIACITPSKKTIGTGGVWDMWRHLDMALDTTPATEAVLAEVRAKARNEGINYAAGRLAAAFNHGFVDKPLAEVFDVVRMILDTKEELASSMIPAVDGLSGEYAEKFLTEFAGYDRKGGEPEDGQSFLSDEDCHAFVKAFTKGAAQ
ncbi:MULTISPECIES: hypothetical protein [Enterobacter]|uniref:hypothetical protein n=1 Tax=Enterobacter TaxID=547 RepID=UPI00287ADD79|nr:MULTISPECIES: hypothetical protein [Enterobacter]MDS1913311.1 hypothetical protein [Enterobacter asburiae]